MNYRMLLLFAVLCLAGCASVSTTDQSPTADEVAVRATVNEIYTIVSGEKGVPRHWDRLKELMMPSAYLAISGRAKDGSTRSRTFSVDDFIKGATANSQQESFFESPLVTRVEIFGGVATAFSSYASRRVLGGEPFARGVNAFTLVKTPQGWRICVIAWSEESTGVALPGALTVGQN